MSTYTQKKETVERTWHIIDAQDLIVGRLSTEVATLLRGKHKVTYTPNVDCGDFVIIINADKVKFTGNKLEDKIYYRHTNHPGGLKQATAKEIFAKHPERILEHSIKGMLPKSKLGRAMYKKLFIYCEENHPHSAQNPQEYKLKQA